MAQLPASSSKLARDVGDQAVTVTIGGAELAAGDLDGYTVRRGRGNVDEQPTAATCTVNVYAAALPQLPAVGDDLVVELGVDALAWLGVDDTDPAVPRFAGTVTDASIVPGRFTDAGKDVVQVIAASPLAKLGRTFIGDTPWPQDLDADRASRILAESYATTVTGVVFGHWQSPDQLGAAAEWTDDDGAGSVTFVNGDPSSSLTAGSGLIVNAADQTSSFFVGRLVDVTPGTQLRVTADVGMVLYTDAGASATGHELVVGPATTPYTPTDDPDGAGSTGPAWRTDVTGALYTVPAGVTQLLVGVRANGVHLFGAPASTSMFGLWFNELTVTSFDAPPAAGDFRTWVSPDLRVGSTVGDDFVYGGTGYTTLSRPAADAGDFFKNRLSDPLAGSQGAAYPPQDYYFGHLVPCTEGATYQLNLQLGVNPSGSWDALNLVIGDPTDPGAVRTQLAGPGATTDLTITGEDGGPGTGAGSFSTLWTAPAGATEVMAGWEAVNLDRTVDNTFSPLSVYVNHLTWTPLSVDGPYLEAIGGTVQVVPRDVDRQNALQLLTDLALDARGLVLDTRAGKVSYADADDRRGTPVAVTLDDSECIVGSTWSTGLAGVVNDVVLRYGTAEPQAELRVTDDPSVTAHGSIGISRSTQLALAAEAERVAARLLSRPAYRLPALMVDVLRTLTSSAQRLGVLQLDQGSLIELTDFPASGPMTTGRQWVEGYTERLTAQGWRFELAVTPYVAGGPGVILADIDPALTFDQVPDDVTLTTAWAYDPT